MNYNVGDFYDLLEKEQDEANKPRTQGPVEFTKSTPLEPTETSKGSKLKTGWDQKEIESKPEVKVDTKPFNSEGNAYREYTKKQAELAKSGKLEPTQKKKKFS